MYNNIGTDNIDYEDFFDTEYPREPLYHFIFKDKDGKTLWQNIGYFYPDELFEEYFRTHELYDFLDVKSITLYTVEFTTEKSIDDDIGIYGYYLYDDIVNEQTVVIPEKLCNYMQDLTDYMDEFAETNELAFTVASNKADDLWDDLFQNSIFDPLFD